MSPCFCMSHFITHEQDSPGSQKGSYLKHQQCLLHYLYLPKHLAVPLTSPPTTPYTKISNISRCRANASSPWDNSYCSLGSLNKMMSLSSELISMLCLLFQGNISGVTFHVLLLFSRACWMFFWAGFAAAKFTWLSEAEMCKFSLLPYPFS